MYSHTTYPNCVYKTVDNKSTFVCYDTILGLKSNINLLKYKYNKKKHTMTFVVKNNEYSIIHLPKESLAVSIG